MEKKRIKGKASLCAVCKQNEIILTAEMLKLARPACKECSNTKEAREFRARRAVLESLIPEQTGLEGIGYVWEDNKKKIKEEGPIL
jgi:hypothetical protein